MGATHGAHAAGCSTVPAARGAGDSTAAGITPELGADGAAISQPQPDGGESASREAVDSQLPPAPPQQHDADAGVAGDSRGESGVTHADETEDDDGRASAGAWSAKTKASAAVARAPKL